MVLEINLVGSFLMGVIITLIVIGTIRLAWKRKHGK